MTHDTDIKTAFITQHIARKATRCVLPLLLMTCWSVLPQTTQAYGSDSELNIPRGTPTPVVHSYAHTQQGADMGVANVAVVGATQSPRLSLESSPPARDESYSPRATPRPPSPGSTYSYNSQGATPWPPTPAEHMSLYEQFIERSGYAAQVVDANLGILLNRWFRGDSSSDPVYTTALQIALDYDAHTMYSTERQAVDRPSIQRTCNVLKALLRCNDQSPDYIWHLYDTVMEELPNSTLLHEEAIFYLHRTHESLNWHEGLAPLALQNTIQLVATHQTIERFNSVGALVAQICMVHFDTSAAHTHLMLLTQNFVQDPFTTDPTPLLQGAITTLQAQRQIARQSQQSAFSPSSRGTPNYSQDY